MTPTVFVVLVLYHTGIQGVEFVRAVMVLIATIGQLDKLAIPLHSSVYRSRPLLCGPGLG